uniref:Uncharacterized protein n=1 Tax=viral metagenome TaxID=1070528 RepID=A0A6M3JYH9_9ZZZZ
MPSNPYPLNLTLYDTDGSTVQVSKLITARNETTAETISETTDGSGQVILDLANLTSSYTNSDVITIYSVDGDKTVYVQHTVDTSVGSYTTSLTYIDTSVTDSTELRYFTASEFREFFNMDSYNATSSPAGIKTEQIERIGVGVELEIDRITRSKFDDNSGSYYTATNEYHDAKWLSQRDFFSKYGPIVSVTKFEVNSEAEGETADWTNLAESDYSDYWSYDADTGRFRIENSAYYPPKGPKQVRLTYTYGVSSTPKDIKHLAMLMTAREMATAGLMSLAIKGTQMEGSGGSINILQSMDRQIERLLNIRMRTIATNA